MVGWLPSPTGDSGEEADEHASRLQRHSGDRPTDRRGLRVPRQVERTTHEKFSPRVQEIRKATDGPDRRRDSLPRAPPRTRAAKSSRRFELTEFEAPTKIRWTERSKNAVTVPDGGYDLSPGEQAKPESTIHNTFEGHGFGKLFVGPASRAAAKDAPAFALRIKTAVGSLSVPRKSPSGLHGRALL